MQFFILLRAKPAAMMTGGRVRQMLTNTRTSESDIVQKVKLGDRTAFEHIYREHRRQVYSLCIRMTRNTADAEELTQDVFLQLFRKIGSFRGESSLWTWLHRLTLNIILMDARHKRLSRTVPLAENDEPEADESAWVNSALAHQDPVLSGSINRLALLRAIKRLAPGYRTVLWLHDVLGYQHDEIAEFMCCTTGSTKSQLHRARLRMRAQLLGRSVQQRARHRGRSLRRKSLRILRDFAILGNPDLSVSGF